METSRFADQHIKLQHLTYTERQQSCYSHQPQWRSSLKTFLIGEKQKQLLIAVNYEPFLLLVKPPLAATVANHLPF